MSNTPQPEVMKMIKSDAIIDIKVGAGFIQKLNALMMYFATTKTPEEFEVFQEELKSYTSEYKFSQDWMEHFVTLSILLREIQSEAEKQGFTYEKPFDSLIQELEDLSNTEDN